MTTFAVLIFSNSTAICFNSFFFRPVLLSLTVTSVSSSMISALIPSNLPVNLIPSVFTTSSNRPMFFSNCTGSFSGLSSPGEDTSSSKSSIFRSNLLSRNLLTAMHSSSVTPFMLSK